MKKIIYIIGLLSLVACKKNIVPKPDHFLDEQQMESLLYDFGAIRVDESNRIAYLGLATV